MLGDAAMSIAMRIDDPDMLADVIQKAPIVLLVVEPADDPHFRRIILAWFGGSGVVRIELGVVGNELTVWGPLWGRDRRGVKRQLAGWTAFE